MKYKNNPPQSPIAALGILKPQSDIKSEVKKEENEIVFILVVDSESFEGRGAYQSIAKTKAYKKAVLFYDTNKTIDFY